MLKNCLSEWSVLAPPRFQSTEEPLPELQDSECVGGNIADGFEVDNAQDKTTSLESSSFDTFAARLRRFPA
jgi:hypothetical protein